MEREKARRREKGVQGEKSAPSLLKDGIMAEEGTFPLVSCTENAIVFP